MANEITTNQATGLTLTARLVVAGAYVGAVIALTESGTVTGHYTGGPPAGTAAALYVVLILLGAEVIADGLLRWDGAEEVLPASQTGTILADVRKINNVTVAGAGIAGNAWRPA